MPYVEEIFLSKHYIDESWIILETFGDGSERH